MTTQERTGKTDRTKASSFGSALKPYVYAARQPIYSAGGNIFGYELLYRAGKENFFHESDLDKASHAVIDIASLHGFKVLSSDRLAFINCTREVLVSGAIRVLPPEQVVVEILETVPADEQVRSACVDLRADGYRIALDDFVMDDPRSSLVEFASFLKVDLTLVSTEEAASIAQCYQGCGVKLLAEKVENIEDFMQMKTAGFHLFQGFHFQRPEMLRMRRVPTDQMVYRKLIEAVSRPKVNLHEVESAIRLDGRVCLRLLRYLHVAVLGLRNEIRSLKYIPARLEEDEVSRWRGLANVLEMTESNPLKQELCSLIRARCGELTEVRVHRRDDYCFLNGLVWLMEVFLQIPMRLVLEDIQFDQKTKEELLEETRRLAAARKFLLAYEPAPWRPTDNYCDEVQLVEELMAALPANTNCQNVIPSIA